MILRINSYYFTSTPCRVLTVKKHCVCCQVGTELFSTDYIKCFLGRVELVITSRHTCPVVKDDAPRRLKQQLLDLKPDTLSWAAHFERQPSRDSAVLRLSPMHRMNGWKRCSWYSIFHYSPQTILYSVLSHTAVREVDERSYDANRQTHSFLYVGKNKIVAYLHTFRCPTTPGARSYFVLLACFSCWCQW
jgi:hypothetical protein